MVDLRKVLELLRDSGSWIILNDENLPYFAIHNRHDDIVLFLHEDQTTLHWKIDKDCANATIIQTKNMTDEMLVEKINKLVEKLEKLKDLLED